MKIVRGGKVRPGLLASLVLGAVLGAGTAATAAGQGGLVVEGQGPKRELSPAQFSAPMRAKYETFRSRCTQCHSMERAIEALQTGVTPISKQPFNKKGIKKYVVKMMRKPNSGIAKSDAKEIVQFLQKARAMVEGK